MVASLNRVSSLASSGRPEKRASEQAAKPTQGVSISAPGTNWTSLDTVQSCSRSVADYDRVE